MPRTPLVLLLPLALPLIVSCQGKPPDPAAALQGTWRPTSIVEAGKPVTGEDLTAARMIIAGNTIKFHGPGGKDHEAPFILDPATDPPSITIQESADPTVGIYKLEGDKLTLCVVRHWVPGAVRPKEFAAPPGSFAVLMVFERVKE
jgi:uncharacterized protein (TIGR03067 family)